jgi:LysM repeat protein
MSAPTAARNAVVVAPAVRLTRRGRALLVLVVAAVLLTAFSLGRTGSQAADVLGAPGAAAPSSTTVQPGDSLWTVAQRIAPEHDTREVVAQIQRLNDLDSATLQVGQLLLLPTSV